ncbi:MAG: hypothetical protein IPI77_19820 [Saprospiraceae bacterium]|nr:hypothetical protein [Saprospiraceae bacterium]
MSKSKVVEYWANRDLPGQNTSIRLVALFRVGMMLVGRLFVLLGTKKQNLRLS